MLSQEQQEGERVPHLRDAREGPRGLDEVGAGNIVALIGLKNSFTGDTICDPDDPVILGA